MGCSYLIVAYYDDFHADYFRFDSLHDMLEFLKELKKLNKYRTFGTYRRFTVK